MGHKIVAGLAFFITTAIWGCRTPSNRSQTRDTPPPPTVSSGPKITLDGLKSWRDGSEFSDWDKEREFRKQVLNDFLYFDDAQASQDKYGFRPGQTPRLAWKWFEENPVGFQGVPYVVLKTILDLDHTNCVKYDLCSIADIWKREASDGSGKTIDHIGVGPNPYDYDNGVAKAPSQRQWKLPYGLVFQGGKPSDKYNDGGPFAAPISDLEGSAYAELHQKKYQDEKAILNKYGDSDAGKLKALDEALDGLRAKFPGKISELAALIAEEPYKPANSRPPHEQSYADNYKTFGRSSGLDPVFFSCAACHVGRVEVNQKVEFIPGAPNTQVQAQYYSKLLMETGIALSLGFNRNSPNLIVSSGQITPHPTRAIGLATAIFEKAATPAGLASLYGSSPAQMLRGKLMVWRVLNNYLSILKDIIGSAIKVHYIYFGVANQRGYDAKSLAERGLLQEGQGTPNIFEHRTGQMDAFGIASGLVAIHSIRPDFSFLDFLYRDEFNVFTQSGKSKVFGGFPYFPPGPLSEPIDDGSMKLPDGTPDRKAIYTKAKNLVFGTVKEWGPPVAAPIDIKALFMSGNKFYANWDANQGAEARTLASGTSATGDPRLVNVEIHEPLNPFINHLPPTAYPFAIDLAKAQEGRKLFKEYGCATCHSPGNETVYDPQKLDGVDPNRTLVNTSVSQTMLAGLVLEACSIYFHNNPGKAGNDYCMPKGDTPKARLDNYFDDTPGRLENGKSGHDIKRAGGKVAGYKADVLLGIWSQAPYLHNGSVPTLGQLLCPQLRPKTFYRGNIAYDQDLVGFEWETAGKRPSQNDLLAAEVFDTTVFSRSNRGHTFGKDGCPNLSGVENDRAEVARRIKDSKVGSLLEYLKTL